MRAILLAGGISLLISLIGTRYAIRQFTKMGYGQEVRDDGPTTHHVKRGTPTMGGVVLIGASVIGYFAAKIITGLETALGTRHRIGAAQGILMERHRLSLHQAFTVLQRYSRTSNEPLSDVAAQVVEESERGYAGPDPRGPAPD